MRIYQRDEILYMDFSLDGRRIRKKVGSKMDAENALAAVKVDILRGEFRFKREQKVIFKDFAKEYIEYAKINKRSWTRDETSLKWLLSHFGNLLLSKITPKHIEDYKKARLEKVKPSTINRELMTLSHIFTIAEKFRKFDGKNPVKEVKYFQEKQYVIKVLDREEIRRLVEASSGYLREMIILALNTGMRKGEILNLRWNDIDFTEHYIYIKETKSNKTKKVPMNGIVSGVLKSMERKGSFVFQNSKTDTRFRDFFRSFKTACRKAGVPDLRFHDLRHTAATLMVMGGVDLVTVKEILGHSKIEMTMRYAHPTPENKRRAVNVLGSVFEDKKHGTKLAQEPTMNQTTSLLSGSKN